MGFLEGRGRSYQRYHESLRVISRRKYVELVAEMDEDGDAPMDGGASSDDVLMEEADRVYRNIIDTITNLSSITLYEYQLNMARLAEATLMQYIYRKVWARKKQEILDNHGFTDVEDTLLVHAPRRAGKTLTLAVWVLSVATNVEKDEVRNFRIAVFATGEDAAVLFLEECKTQWKQINRKHKFHMHSKRMAIYLISKEDPTDIRIIQAYCGTGDVRIFTFRLQCEVVVGGQEGGGGERVRVAVSLAVGKYRVTSAREGEQYECSEYAIRIQFPYAKSPATSSPSPTISKSGAVPQSTYPDSGTRASSPP